MNKEQRKFRKVIKSRRRHDRRDKAEKSRKTFNRLSLTERARIRFEQRHEKDEAKKKRAAIRKELGYKK